MTMNYKFMNTDCYGPTLMELEHEGRRFIIDRCTGLVNATLFFGSDIAAERWYEFNSAAYDAHLRLLEHEDKVEISHFKLKDDSFTSITSGGFIAYIRRNTLFRFKKEDDKASGYYIPYTLLKGVISEDVYGVISYIVERE